MKNIKFRVWDSSLNKWSDQFTPANSYYFIWGYNNKNGKGILGLVPNPANENFIYQQSTGIFDKNNKEIFEGDIIENNNFIGICEYNEKTANFFCKRIKNKKEGINELMGVIYWDKVIGNIYENPELLKIA